jgi:molybdenum cofactor cytidylyltransferase
VTLLEALALGEAPGIISIVGGGGKSSLMFALGESLPGRIIITTTTRVFAAQVREARAWCTREDPDFEARLAGAESPLLVVESVPGERAKGVDVDVPAALLARPDVDWVVVEADGSRMLPVKAPADHEPVIPEETSWVIPVAGIDALSAPIEKVAHRPERVTEVTGCALHETLTPESLAVLLASARGGSKGVPPAAGVRVLLNKVESAEQWSAARETARHLIDTHGLDRVAIGALHGDVDGWEAVTCGPGE